MTGPRSRRQRKFRVVSMWFGVTFALRAWVLSKRSLRVDQETPTETTVQLRHLCAFQSASSDITKALGHSSPLYTVRELVDHLMFPQRKRQSRRLTQSSTSWHISRQFHLPAVLFTCFLPNDIRTTRAGGFLPTPDHDHLLIPITSQERILASTDCNTRIDQEFQQCQENKAD